MEIVAIFVGAVIVVGGPILGLLFFARLWGFSNQLGTLIEQGKLASKERRPILDALSQAGGNGQAPAPGAPGTLGRRAVLRADAIPPMR
jgi:hypothetical protein